jgi:Sulfotransferase domain
LAYFGHHKCGSTMVLKIIGKVSDYLGLEHAHFHSPKVWGYESNRSMLDRVARDRNLDFVSYISADGDMLGDKERFRGFHIVRDPRDIVVSSYFSHRYSHPTDGWPELVEFRKVLEALPKDEGLIENMKFTEMLPIDGWKTDLFRTLRTWDYASSNVLELRFEELVANPYQTFLEIFEFLGLLDPSEISASSLLDVSMYKARNRYPRLPLLKQPEEIPGWVLLSIVYENRFSKLAEGRKSGEENVKSHYRKGKSGDWKNHFTEAHKAFFKEHYNDLLVKLGYETDDRW